MEAVLIKKSTGEIIKRGQYPRLDLEPIEGLDPDLEWLFEYRPFVAPDYDPRIYVVKVIEKMGLNHQLNQL